MKTKQYMVGISLFVTSGMYTELKRISDRREVSLSELVRGFILEGLKKTDAGQNGGKEQEWVK